MDCGASHDTNIRTVGPVVGTLLRELSLMSTWSYGLYLCADRYILDSSWKQHRWCLQCVFTIIKLIPHASDLLATMNFQFNIISVVMSLLYKGLGSNLGITLHLMVDVGQENFCFPVSSTRNWLDDIWTWTCVVIKRFEPRIFLLTQLSSTVSQAPAAQRRQARASK